MTTLNRYILKKFIRPFAAIVSLLAITIFIAQLMERLDRFLEEGVALGNVIGYLLTSMPFQLLEVLPIATFMATLFVVGNLARTKEYIAGLAGGVAPEKFLGGLLWAGFFISLSALALNETVIPPLTKYSEKVYQEKIKGWGQVRHTVFSNFFVAGAEGRMWSAKLFNLDQEKMERVIIDSYSSGRIGKQIDALSARKVEGGWEFQDGVARTYSGDGLNIVNVESFETRVEPFREEPLDLAIQEPSPEQMNFRTLKNHIDRLSTLGVPTRKLDVDLMMKLAFPFSCFVVVVLGIPIAMRGKGNIGWGIAVSLLLTFAYIAFIEFGKAMAQRMIPPLVGAWMGNLVFLGIALALWMRMRRTA